MNKDEMIEEIAKITNFTAFDYRQGTIQSKTIYTAMAEALYNAGYRKVADDEQIVNTEQLTETLNSTLESGKRMGYATGREETAREILQEMFDYMGSHQKFCIVDDGHKTLIDLDGLWAKGAELAQKYGVELED